MVVGSNIIKIICVQIIYSDYSYNIAINNINVYNI